LGKQMGDTLLSKKRKVKQQRKPTPYKWKDPLDLDDIVQRRRTVPMTETHDDGEDQDEWVWSEKLFVNKAVLSQANKITCFNPTAD
jgi:hypothetical protein